jgi:hypothetical protein
MEVMSCSLLVLASRYVCPPANKPPQQDEQGSPAAKSAIVIQILVRATTKDSINTTLTQHNTTQHNTTFAGCICDVLVVTIAWCTLDDNGDVL